MKSLKKLLAVSFAFILIISGCSSGESKDDKKEANADGPIGISILAADHGWLAALSYNAENTVKELGLDAKILTSSSVSEQAAHIDDLIAMDCSVIVLEPHTDEVEIYAKKIRDAGIKLVLFDRIVDVDYTSYVTGNNPEVGTTVANYLGEKLGGKGTIAVHNVPSAGSVSTERVDNFKKVMKEKYPDIKLVEFSTASFTQEDGLKSGADLLVANKQIDAIFSIDDESSLGFLQAIKDAGRTDIKYMSGCGGSQSYINKIKSETSINLFSATYSPKMIIDAIEMAVKIQKGEKFEKDYYVAPEIINRDNAEDFVDADSPY
ncbi:ribose transport system substrate-binding protein [Breznakia sp. PF5-3]|uniref:substrate-binding domain-containing protein n=1 Tax=unclassified Breznakia TaxID=2623764 RepID=UPI002405A124|nr:MULTISPECIES: substrate-binding domain-containing protein [unclassified Breznakia]MDF9824839.1 ribose transport system substrate-binding protein [Breznakia sp. PM6-1]MDF9835199.1 ribose transport system substrate-binding protein [Breznakia sp. PF5-3]MDF9837311.1 ribose transport system substrate-binding protein [Breznakia sp. PFB2-8]MDF9859765.1 ribose transport system substrate-binding protein [Breznakia sp. PH5-24]